MTAAAEDISNDDQFRSKVDAQQEEIKSLKKQVGVLKRQCTLLEKKNANSISSGSSVDNKKPIVESVSCGEDDEGDEDDLPSTKPPVAKKSKRGGRSVVVDSEARSKPKRKISISDEEEDFRDTDNISSNCRHQIYSSKPNTRMATYADRGQEEYRTTGIAGRGRLVVHPPKLQRDDYEDVDANRHQRISSGRSQSFQSNNLPLEQKRVHQNDDEHFSSRRMPTQKPVSTMVNSQGYDDDHVEYTYHQYNPPIMNRPCKHSEPEQEGYQRGIRERDPAFFPQQPKSRKRPPFQQEVDVDDDEYPTRINSGRGQTFQSQPMRAQYDDEAVERYNYTHDGNSGGRYQPMQQVQQMIRNNYENEEYSGPGRYSIREQHSSYQQPSRPPLVPPQSRSFKSDDQIMYSTGLGIAAARGRHHYIG